MGDQSRNRMSERDELAPLLAELRERRAANGWDQGTLALSLGMSQPWLSKVERGFRSLRELDWPTVEAILKAYGYTTEEIMDRVGRYRLPLPPSAYGSFDSTVSRVHLDSRAAISRPTSTGQVLMSTEWLSGHDPKHLLVWTVAANDLATPEALHRVAAGTQLVTAKHLEPVDGSLVIVAQGGTQALSLWPLSRGWALPLNGAADTAPLRLDPAVCELVAVAFLCIRQLPSKSNTENEALT